MNKFENTKMLAMILLLLSLLGLLEVAIGFIIHWLFGFDLSISFLIGVIPTLFLLSLTVDAFP